MTVPGRQVGGRSVEDLKEEECPLVQVGSRATHLLSHGQASVREKFNMRTFRMNGENEISAGIYPHGTA